MFDAHNLFEYKCPGAGLDLDDHYKRLGHAFFYKSQGRHLNEIKASELSVTFVRYSRPRAMFKTLESEGACVALRHLGIYDVSGVVASPRR